MSRRRRPVPGLITDQVVIVCTDRGTHERHEIGKIELREHPQRGMAWKVTISRPVAEHGHRHVLHPDPTANDFRSRFRAICPTCQRDRQFRQENIEAIVRRRKELDQENGHAVFDISKVD